MEIMYTRMAKQKKQLKFKWQGNATKHINPSPYLIKGHNRKLISSAPDIIPQTI